MDFINNVEMAALVDAGMANTEVIKTTSGDVVTTTIYAGAPFREARQNGDQFSTVVVWKIRRTIVVENGNTTTVETRWAVGDDWANRASLTYNYL